MFETNTNMFNIRTDLFTEIEIILKLYWNYNKEYNK